MKTHIGPLTAEEWCAFRLRDDEYEDLLLCCGETSEFRDAIFGLLRDGGDWRSIGGLMFKRAWPRMVDHGLPQDDRVIPLLFKLWAHYIYQEEDEDVLL